MPEERLLTSNMSIAFLCGNLIPIVPWWPFFSLIMKGNPERELVGGNFRVADAKAMALAEFFAVRFDEQFPAGRRGNAGCILQLVHRAAWRVGQDHG
jgi:hypothetical protein